MHYQSYIVKVTSLKLLLILTDNYNTYLKMYRSRTCVDWFSTFKVEKKTTIYSDYSYAINVKKLKKKNEIKAKKQNSCFNCFRGLKFWRDH